MESGSVEIGAFKAAPTGSSPGGGSAPSAPAKPAAPSTTSAPVAGHRYKVTAYGEATGVQVASIEIPSEGGVYKVTRVRTRLTSAFTYTGAKATKSPKGTWDIEFTLTKIRGKGPARRTAVFTYRLVSGRQSGSGLSFTFAAKLLAQDIPPCANATIGVSKGLITVRTCFANANAAANVVFK